MTNIFNRLADSFILISVLFCLLFWTLDAVIHSTLFPRGSFSEMLFDPDSETIWMRSMVCFVTILGGFVMQKVINRSRRSEKDAIRSNRLFRLVLDTIPVRVFWKDADGLFLGCNRLFAEDAGLSSPDDLIGKDDYQMVWKEQAEMYRSDDFKVFRSGTARLNIEEPQTTPEGKRIWLSTSKVPMTDESGKTIGVLGTYEEITYRKKHEEELHERDIILESVLESISDGILVVGSDGKTITSNSAFADMWRIPREIIEEGDDGSMLQYVTSQLADPGEFLQKVEALYQSHERSHDYVSFKDGRVFERHSAALLHGGEILGRLWSFRDVTDPDKPTDNTERFAKKS